MKRLFNDTATDNGITIVEYHRLSRRHCPLRLRKIDTDASFCQWRNARRPFVLPLAYFRHDMQWFLQIVNGNPIHIACNESTGEDIACAANNHLAMRCIESHNI